MAINGPPVVASDGLSAFKISLSGFALSSLRQKAISSAIAATAVKPRMVRNEAGRTDISIPVVRLRVSDVAPSTRSFRFGATAKTPSTKANALAACCTLAANKGITPRSPGARLSLRSTQAARLSRQDGHSARLAASASNDTPELLDGLLRLANAAREALEDRALVIGQLLADDGDQKDAPGDPGRASDEIGEVEGAP